MPQVLHFTLQVALLAESAETSLKRELLSYTATACSAAHPRQEDLESCPLSHNKFELHFHPDLYLQHKCMRQNHLVLYETQQKRLGSGGFRYEACPFFHTHGEDRSACATTFFGDKRNALKRAALAASPSPRSTT